MMLGNTQRVGEGLIPVAMTAVTGAITALKHDTKDCSDKYKPHPCSKKGISKYRKHSIINMGQSNTLQAVRTTEVMS